MKFIHIADIHASRERLPQTLHILSTLTERAKQGDIDFILFAGDFWDSTITATKGSGFSDIIQAVRELEKHTFLFFIYGTPTHEPSGSLDAFQSDKTKVFSDMCFDIHIGVRNIKKNTDIYFIPEPRRSNYIGKSVKEIDDSINSEIADFIKTRQKKRDDYNRIIVYHGEVKGAVYQNGVSASSPTAIPKELLQSLNADYYALGHIHLPQEVFKNAWYSGSACPKDFGETHDGGYNLVTIEDGETKTERVSFGLPTYETFNMFYSDFLKTKSDFTNKHIRLQFEVTKEEKKTLNIKQIADEIKERTNALSVKLEPTVTETEAAAKSEVVKHKSLVEKMTEYAKEKSLKIPKRATELLKAIEDDTLTKLNFPQHSFELLSLSLRGAIGIRDGQHKEDFDLDFEKLDDGVCCLVGENGKGKCITGDSLILSDNGFEAIGSYDNNERGYRELKKTLVSEKKNLAETSHFYSEEVSQTIRITNSLGMELEGTYDHPVLVFMPDCTYQFKKLRDVTTNDYVCVPRNMQIFPTEHYKFSFTPFIWRGTKKAKIPCEMNINLAKFLGYFIANGSHSDNCIQFSTTNETIGEDYINCVKELFDIDVKKECYKDTAPNYRLNSSVVKQFLEYIFGTSLTTGRYKTIPNCILQGTREEQVTFITALFDCDGSLSKNIFEYLSASKQIVVTLQNMLLNFGIISSHRTKNVKGYDWTYHRLVIGSLCVDNLFYKILKGSLKYKYSRSINANTNVDIIPYIADKIDNDLPRLKNGYLKSKNGKTYRNPIRVFSKNYKCGISYATLGLLMSLSYQCEAPEVKALIKLFCNISQKFYFYSKIQSVEKLNQPKVVYDFTIPSTHQFYSNGFISHNTTLVENSHPYPCMLTRDGTLKEHFYLKDSHRILTYKDEKSLYYRISMLIDGKNKTGSTQYFVETSKDRESWKTLPETDGSLESYKQWVNGTFGSLDVFLRTAFFAKEQTKNVPDISATTKGERMELLSKLAGTEHLKEVSVIARDKRKEVEKQCEKIEAEIESYAKFEQTIKDNEQDIISWQNKAKGAETAIAIDEKKVSELRAKDAEYQKVKAVSEANKALYEQYKKEYDETKDLADAFSEAVNNKDIFQKVIDSKTEIEVNTPLIQKWQEEISAKREKLEKVTEAVITLTKAISECKLALSKLETKKSLLNSQIADVSEVCPTCGAPLSEHKKKELSKHIESARTQLTQVLNDEQIIKEGLAVHEKSLKTIDITETLKNEIAELERKLSKLQSDTHACSDFLETVDQIYTEHTYDKAVDELKKLGSELDLLESKMAELSDTETAEDVSAELSEAERRLQTDRNTLADLQATIRSAEKENERYRAELAKSEENRKEKKRLEADIGAYLFIEDAFSNKGIPAIELRESAPEISDIANKILHESYGNKFDLRFGSTSELKAKRKADEDFNIIVYDSENGDEKTIDQVSSGERIWLKQALFYAFSIVQMNRTGFNFRTRLIDESDGSLDGTLRPKYLQMVTAAHRQADSRLTILITHSQEIKDIAQQVIEI